MADADVNEDLLDYEEEETTEQVSYNSYQLVLNRYSSQNFIFRLMEPKMELRLRKRAPSRVTTSPSTAADSGISC